MKTYLKDLSPEEVIRRLKAGEVVKCEKTNFVYKVIDDLPCIIYDDGEVVYNASLTICKNGPFYFDTPDELKLEVGKCYRTRDGRKAFISCKIFDDEFPFLGIVTDCASTETWLENGKFNVYQQENQLDLISEWTDETKLSDCWKEHKALIEAE